MNQVVTLSNREKMPFTFEILDEDDQPFDSLPAGVSIAVTSSDPAIADAPLNADNLGGTITSGKDGKATLTFKVSGTAVPFPDETVEVTVSNSAPASLNLSLGTAIPE